MKLDGRRSSCWQGLSLRIRIRGSGPRLSPPHVQCKISVYGDDILTRTLEIGDTQIFLLIPNKSLIKDIQGPSTAALHMRLENGEQETSLVVPTGDAA